MENITISSEKRSIVTIIVVIIIILITIAIFGLIAIVTPHGAP